MGAYLQREFFATSRISPMHACRRGASGRLSCASKPPCLSDVVRSNPIMEVENGSIQDDPFPLQ